MRIGLIGCGFVSDYYMATLPLYPELSVVSAFDRDPERLAAFCRHHGVAAATSLDEVLADERVDLVLNLTNPRSHYEVSLAALQAGKHVYSEKPLAMALDQAEELAALAAERSLQLSAAPCSVLGETAQTMWRAVRDGRIGQVRLVYAEMDEGRVFAMPHHRWASASGAPWPSRDEFEVGTTIEHAGYVLSWLPAMFGPAARVTGIARCLYPEKGTVERPVPVSSPDLTISCIEFHSGVIARLTCSLVAPHDHSLRIVGDDGVLETEDTWFYGSKVHLRRWFALKGRYLPWPKERVPLVRAAGSYSYRGTQQMDFARGVAELAGSVAEHRPNRLGADVSLHVTELVLAISGALTTSPSYEMTSTFAPPAPMPWATAAAERSWRSVVPAVRRGVESLAARA